MSHEFLKPNMNPGKQLDIEFEKLSAEAELNEVANKYKVVDKSQIFKDAEGIWRFYKSYRPVKEWAEEMERLEEKEKDDIYHQN